MAPPSPLIGAPRPAVSLSTPTSGFPPVSSADSFAASYHHIPAMALVLQLLPLLLSRAHGSPGGKPSRESQNGDEGLRQGAGITRRSGMCVGRSRTAGEQRRREESRRK